MGSQNKLHVIILVPTFTMTVSAPLCRALNNNISQGMSVTRYVTRSLCVHCDGRKNG